MRRLIALLFVFSLSLHAAAAEESVKKDPVRVCTHLGFEPFVIHEGKQLFGIDIDIIKSVFEDSHYNPSLVSMPWARLINSLKEGTCDIGFSLFDRDERRNFVDFIFDVPMHFSTCQASIPFHC